MGNKDIIVIGASAGGFDALKMIVAGLPGDLPAAILIVHHVPSYSLNILARFLEANGKMPCRLAVDREEVRPGNIYVAVGDHHLLVDPSGRISVTRGPKENRFRPAIDPLFRSAAAAYGSRVIGVVLTGHLDDGTAGLWQIKERGGTAVVQDPDTAFASGMPQSALAHVAVDHVVSLKEIAPLLVRLVQEPAKRNGDLPMSELIKTELRIAHGEHGPGTDITRYGEPSVFACPECHGVLLRLKESGPLRFRCHTGHAYSMEALLAGFDERIEETIWNAVRSIEENVMLLRHAAGELTQHQHLSEADSLLQRAEAEQRRSDLLRQALKADPS